VLSGLGIGFELGERFPILERDCRAPEPQMRAETSKVTIGLQFAATICLFAEAGLVASRSEKPRSARCDWPSSSGRERSLPSAPPVLCFLRCLRPNGKPVHADAEFRGRIACPPRAHHSNHVSVARVRRTSSKSIVQVGLHRPSAQRGTPELPVLQTTKSKLVIKLKTATMRQLNSRHTGRCGTSAASTRRHGFGHDVR